MWDDSESHRPAFVSGAGAVMEMTDRLGPPDSSRHHRRPAHNVTGRRSAIRRAEPDAVCRIGGAGARTLEIQLISNGGSYTALRTAGSTRSLSGRRKPGVSVLTHAPEALP